jgi:hypothetical protein
VTADEADLIDRPPKASHPSWVRPISNYRRRETALADVVRFG